jgi:hypothetical protein
MRKSINKNLKENEKIVEIWVEGTIHGLWGSVEEVLHS